MPGLAVSSARGVVAMVMVLLAAGCHRHAPDVSATSGPPCDDAPSPHEGDHVPQHPSPPPRLIVQITVDQLRGDMPRRMQGRDPESGLDVLLARAVYFTNAHYAHANTETAVGHATLFTGAAPAQHGVVANDWFDREAGKRVYNVHDGAERTLGEDGTRGVSPRSLRATTWGDELVLATGGAARVFSVSGKDRGAVLPAGHLGKAYWFSKHAGGFVTSTYHFQALAPWVAHYNSLRHADGYRGRAWTLRHPQQWYRFGNADDRPEENSVLPSFGRVFPHPYPSGDDGDFYDAISMSPALDELVVDFALTLLDIEGLGRGPATDVLAVSLSATDYVGHTFGPGSVEAEDNLARLGVTLSRLLGTIEMRVGRENVWVVLSADHGGGEIPETLAKKGFDSGRIDAAALVADLSGELARRYRTRANLVADFIAPYVYLNEAEVTRLGLSLSDVERDAARFLQTHPGIERVFSAHDLAHGSQMDAIERRVRRSFFPGRSGNLHVVEKQTWLMYHAPADKELSAGHGSPWPYDTHVPVLFVIPGLPPATVHRHVAPSDIAPTLAALLGTRWPSGAGRAVLTEVAVSR